MGNISLKRVVADTLATYFSTAISGLAGKVSSVQAGPETTAGCLALKVLPEKMMFECAEPQEIYSANPDDGKVIVDVGQFTGRITLQLFTTSPAEREKYEQAILDLFLGSVWSPGVLYLNTPNLIVNGYSSLYSADFKVFLDSEEWNEEMAFESKRYSFLDIDVDFPALTTYDAVNIEHLQVCLSDMDSVVVTVADIDSDYVVEVLEDGSTVLLQISTGVSFPIYGPVYGGLYGRVYA